MEIPPETTCEAISYITDPRDVLALERTNVAIATLAKQCVEVLRYDSRTKLVPESINVDFVLQFSRLRIVEPYIRLETLSNIYPVAQMPFISQVSFDFSHLNEWYELPVSARDAFVMMMEFFLSAFQTHRVINERSQTIKSIRSMKPEDRFFFRGPYYSGDVILRNNTFAYLSEYPPRIGENEIDEYLTFAERYTHPTRLVTNIPTKPSSYELFVSIREFHFTSNIDLTLGGAGSTLLNDISYMNNEGALTLAKMYMVGSSENKELFDRGYDFEPDEIETSYFPATGEPIALDIPFIIVEDHINKLLEWFPKLTLSGLFLFDYSREEEALKNVLKLLESRGIQVIIYSTALIEELQSELTSFVQPLATDIYDII